MLGCVLLVVDGSIPADEAAKLAHGFIPKPTAVVVLQVVPQIPYGWITWPALPNAAEGLARASEYVSEAARHLQALCWNASTRVYLSPLSAAEMDREVLRQVEMLRPDLICLALERGRVRAGIVRGAVVPVLVANLPSTGETANGVRVESRSQNVLAPLQSEGLSNLAGALLAPAGSQLPAWKGRKVVHDVMVREAT